MPELPEVETIKETLKQCVLNQKIVDVQVHYPKLIQNMDVQLFAKKLIGQTFNEIMRKGKYLIFHLSDGFLIVHLRMEGKFYYDYHHIDRHSHLIFTFDNQKNLVYHDVRKFGRMVYYDKNVDIYQVLPLSQLGKEPFELKDGTYFYQKIKKSQKPLKQILLDQTILAGIGNIYADEICFASRLSPLKKGNTLTLKDCNELIKQAKIVLSKAIQLGGSTIKSYHSAQGIDGLFQNELMVYGKKGKPCPICHQPIVKIKVSGRGTHYCPNCQKED